MAACAGGARPHARQRASRDATHNGAKAFDLRAERLARRALDERGVGGQPRAQAAHAIVGLVEESGGLAQDCGEGQRAQLAREPLAEVRKDRRAAEHAHKRAGAEEEEKTQVVQRAGGHVGVVRVVVHLRR